jgi:ketosteroid isomerase-like protein
VQRYFNAYPSDWETMAKLRHPEFVEEWPQSNERIVGHENYRAIHENYPGGTPGTEIERVVGTEDRVVITALFTPMRVVGEGDTFTVEAKVDYSDGKTVFLITIVELKDGKVYRQRTYFADPFEAPAWRAPWVTRLDAAHA